jgi:ABC-type lipoprotein release transport system permease subunit
MKEFKTFFEPRILIKLKSLEYTDTVKEKIQEMQGAYLIVTFKEIYKQKRTSFLLTDEYLNFQTIISILLISLGIISISIVNLFERSKTIVLQHIRGLDRKQLFKINLSSMLGIIISALIIGIITSLATMLGYVNWINSTFLAYSILEYRIIVLPYHYLYLIATVLAVFLSLIIPIAIFIKRIQSKVEEII